MFEFLRRRPSPYAVAIRDSMTQTPEKWTMIVKEKTCGLDCGTIWIPCNPQRWFGNGRMTRADRRCIREGIEAWVAWSVSKREVSDGPK